MALHQQLQDKGASDAVFDRLEALFDQLANPKSDKAAFTTGHPSLPGGIGSCAICKRSGQISFHS